MSDKYDKSWHKMGVDYKDSKQPHIEEEEKYKKKKQKKKNKRSKHKHEYIPGIYYSSYSGFNSNGKKQNYVMCGSHCKICGRVNNISFMWFNTADKVEHFKEEYPNYVEIVLPEGWNYFKDKNIPV